MMNETTARAFTRMDRALAINLARRAEVTYETADPIEPPLESLAATSWRLSTHPSSTWGWKQWTEVIPKQPICHWVQDYALEQDDGWYHDPEAAGLSTCFDCVELLQKAVETVAQDLHPRHRFQGLNFEEDKEHLFLCVPFLSLPPLNRNDLFPSLHSNEYRKWVKKQCGED